MKTASRLLTTLLLMLNMWPLTAQEHTSRFYINRVENYVRSGAWHEAKHAIDEGLRPYPDDPDLRYWNGRYFYVSGNMREARYNLVRAIQDDDQHFKAKRLLVDVADSLHQYSSAVCYINELLEFQPYDRDLWRRKIALYRRMGNQVEADAALTRLAHIYPNDSIVRGELRKRQRAMLNGTMQRNSLAEAAADLENWLDQDPANLQYYIELTSVYERMGEYERALGSARRGLVHFPDNQQLVSKVLGIMTGMGLYAQALTFARQHGGAGSKTYEGLLREVADDARMRDPYEANGRLYARTKDRDALNYLLNTALTRGYEEDARFYLREAMKRDGRTKALLAKQYSLERHAGNEQAALRILEEMYAATPYDEEVAADYSDAMLRLAIADMDGMQWEDADAHLARALQAMPAGSEAWPSAVCRRITVKGRLGHFDQARDTYRQAAGQTDAATARRFASAYEDIASVRLRTLIEEERYEEALAEARELLAVVPGSESALRTCINMSYTLRHEKQFQVYAQLGWKAHPDNPYFIVKQAASLRQQGKTTQALGLLRPRRHADEWTNPQLAAAYAGIAGEWAGELLHDHMPGLALQVIDSALAHSAENRELLYLRGVASEHLKDFRQAFDLQRRYYNPSNAEQQDYYEHIRYLGFRSHRNRIDATYTRASYDTREGSLASVGRLYSVASVAYSRAARRDTYTAQMSYKGIDGFHSDDETEPGGVGVELMAQWEHSFWHRWTWLFSAAWSNRFFNKVGANAGLALDAGHGWTAACRLGYRRTPETYIFLGGNSIAGSQASKLNLVILSPSVEKSWERIKLTVSTDLTLVQSSLYYNVGVRGKWFYNNDNVSAVSLLASCGSFPELNFFEQTALRGLSHTNAMIGFDAQYLCTHNLSIGLAGSWNTCFNPYRQADGSLADSYLNICTLSAQMHIAF